MDVMAIDGSIIVGTGLSVLTALLFRPLLGLSWQCHSCEALLLLIVSAIVVVVAGFSWWVLRGQVIDVMARMYKEYKEQVSEGA